MKTIMGIGCSLKDQIKSSITYEKLLIDLDGPC